MSGQIISHYYIHRVARRAGIGVVYKAEDTRLHRLVALKLLPENVGHALAVECPLQTASALNHPNICNVLQHRPAGEPEILQDTLEVSRKRAMVTAILSQLVSKGRSRSSRRNSACAGT